MKKIDKVIFITSISIIFVSGIIFLFIKNKKNKVESGELLGDDAINLIQTWDSKSNIIIEKLHPKIRSLVYSFINELKTLGISYRAYSGFRNFEEQASLYGKGRSEQDLIKVGVDKKHANPTEKKVTDSIPGKSFHNYGLAFDGVEIKNNVALWINPRQQEIVKIALKYGLYWGGNFSIKDTPHFEFKNFGRVQYLLSLYNSGNLDSSGYLIV